MDAALQSASLLQDLPRRAEATAPARVHVLLVAPFSHKGGGMGRMMAYLADQDLHGKYSFELVESRGRGPAALSVWPLLRAAWTLRQRARGAAPVLLHLNMAERGSVARKGVLLYLGRALGVRTILHLHAAEIMTFYEHLGRFARARVRAVFNAADTCIVLGEGIAGWVQSCLGVPAGRIEVLRNGVPCPTLLPFHLPGAQPTLLFLGNLQARKGLADLLAALSSTPCAGLDFELIVAGGGDATPWRALARARGLEARVTFTGWLDRAEVTALLARACVLILPSYHEGLPLVLLEAASMGVPSITTPVGAIGEVFTDGETALLLPAGDVAALAGAIRRMIDTPSLRVQIGRNARTLYDQSFSMDIFTKGLADIYRKTKTGVRA